MKLQRGSSPSDPEAGFWWLFWCPGCDEPHSYNTDRVARPCWTFDGDVESPTFTPSLLYPDKKPRCHLFVTAGKIIYCDDCEHALAGQTVDLPEIPD